MSQQNVEVVRAMYAAFARGDRAMLVSHLDPAIRVYDRPVHPEASVYEGPEGFLRFAQSGRGKGSALGVEESIVNVWKLLGGKCVELRNYSTIDEALEAVEAGQRRVSGP